METIRCLLPTSLNQEQCDQIGRFIGLWATFQSLRQQLIILPKSPTFLGNFCKGVFNFWATFIDIWRLFIDHTEFKANKASFDTLNDSFGVGKRRSIKEIIKRQM